MRKAILLSVSLALLSACAPAGETSIAGSYGVVCSLAPGDRSGVIIRVRGNGPAPKVEVIVCESICTKLKGSKVKHDPDHSLAFVTGPPPGGAEPLQFVGRLDEDTLIIEGRGQQSSIGPLQLKRTNLARCPLGQKPASPS